jgi:pilus assembly protein Flp/PilA
LKKLCIQKLLACLNDENGATAIEYGLITSLITIVIVAACIVVGMTLGNNYSTLATNMNSAGR